ncbi:MAG: hypothetical protein ACLTSX_10715 [Collinsella sp.]
MPWLPRCSIRLAANGGVKPLLAQLAGGLGIGDGTAAALDGALFGAVFGMLPPERRRGVHR